MISGCGHGGEEGGETKPSGEAVAGVRTTIVTAGPFTEMFSAIGSTAPRVGHVAALAAPQSARIEKVWVTAGQRVGVGDPLVEFDQTPFRAATQSAEAALGTAERTYERAQRLVSEGVMPRKEADVAYADLAKARADAANARRAEQLSILRAPIAGVVTRMNAVLGATADPSQPLVEVADPSAVDILLNLPPGDASRVHSGDKVTLSASGSTEPLGIGTVVDVGGAIDSATRSVIIRVQAPATRRPLRIGETIQGRIAVATRQGAVTVPLEALVPEGETFKVFVVDADGLAHSRPVTVGARTEKEAEITSGLTAGERVVTYGAYGLEDSARVVPATPAATKDNP
jgi:RND family efflux transporter MFP subunit